MITVELLLSAMPHAGERAARYAPFLEAARRRFVGNDWHHIAMWLAQIAHESGSLRYVRELASGETYEGRRDLGNTEPGDGPRFKGRGLLQLTGRYNYAACGQELGLPLIDQPELLEQPEHAAMSAGYVWKSHGLGKLCSQPDPVLAVTRRLNGGTTGLDDRRERYQTAMTALKLHASTPALTQGSPATQPTAAPPPAAEIPAPQPVPEIATMSLPAAAALAFAAELWRILRPTDRVEKVSAAIEKAAPVLFDAARQAVPAATNEQQAVEQIKASPQLQQQFKQAAAMRWGDLEPALALIERAAAVDRADMDAAAERTRRLGELPVGKLLPFYLIAAGQFVLTLVVMVGLGWVLHSVVQAISSGKDVGELPSWASMIIGSLLIVIALEWRSIIMFVTGRNQDSSARNALISRLSAEREAER